MPIEIHQIIRSKRKTLALIVKPDGALIVRAPLRISEQAIKEFIEHNREWVRKKRAELLAVLPPSPRQFLSGETFLYLGKSYPLEIVTDQTEPLLLEESFQLAEAARNKSELVFEHWYREQARCILTERVALYVKQHDFQYDKIRITSARTRWGSCSSTGSLSFSWRLIMAPLEVVDYVIVHELVHTVIHNHSKRFWNKVAKIMPDYKDRRKWLRANGRRLILWDQELSNEPIISERGFS